MKKIFVLAGLVLFISFLAMVWLFFGNFFDFAQNLEDTVEDFVPDDATKFIGTWRSDSMEIMFLEDGNYTSSTMLFAYGTYRLENGNLILKSTIGESNGFSNFRDGEATCDYSFSDDTLSLTQSAKTYEFYKDQ